MSSQHGSLIRLKKIFELLEHARALDLSTATAAEAEVERAVTSLLSERFEIARAVGSALSKGEQAEQAVMHALQQSSKARQVRLEQLQTERQATQIACRDRYQASKLQLKQMETAVSWTTAQDEAKRAALNQREEMDRYMSRRDWLKNESQRQSSNE